MPDIQSELRSKILEPALRLTAREYVIRALKEKPGATGIELMAGRPDYMPKTSISPVLTYLHRAGAVRRAYVTGPTGNARRATYAYWIENENAKITAQTRVPVRPGSKGGATNQSARLVGAGTLGRSVPEEHNVLEDPDVRSWQNMGGGMKAPIEPIRAPIQPPKPEANMVSDGKPRIVVLINNKQRILTIPEARELYVALKDLFG